VDRGALSGGRPYVLALETLVNMSSTRTIADLEHWTWGFRLGLMLMREGESVCVGHTGSMPGFLAAVVCRPATSLGVVVLANTTSNLKVGQLALQVLSLARGVPPRPLSGCQVNGLRSGWYRSGGRDGPSGFSLAGRPTAGHLGQRAEWGGSYGIRRDRARRVCCAHRHGARGATARRAGEGDESVKVRKLYWATYPFTGAPVRFGGPP
jgi:hypothetical protein